MNPYTEDILVEQPTLSLLNSMGWKTQNCFDEIIGKDGTLGRETTSEVVLVRSLRNAIKRLNPCADIDAINSAIEEFTRDRNSSTLVAANQEIYNLMKDGITVSWRDENDEEVEGTIQVIDWKNPSNNDFLAVNQLWITGQVYKRRVDIMGFVNGIPLLFVELKAAHKHIEDAYNGNLRDYMDTIPQIFWYNAFIILSNGSNSKVGSISALMEHFSEWKKISSEGETGIISLETMLKGICEKSRLIDLVENFILYKDGESKLIAKNHQYLGVNNAMNAVIDIKNRQGRLGVFWHTQGSGKSFSMVFFTQKVLRKLTGNWTFIIVTDRTELDDQIYKNFVSTGAIKEKKTQAESCAHLKQLLSEDHQIIFTLIQKFQWEDVSEPVTSRDDIIVITDEAHRSQYDTLARNMRKALPNASFIGFTGTPLVEGDAITREVFGDYVSVYDFSAAIEDGATVPLYYENRIPELELINENLNDDLNEVIENAMLDEDQEKRLEREFMREYHLITREERLDRIAADIVQHFMGRGYMGKAMVVSIDKITTVRMYLKVKAEWDKYKKNLERQMQAAPPVERGTIEAKLKFMNNTDMAVVVSPSQNEINDFKKKGIDILPIRKRMQTDELDVKFKDPTHPLRVVFVCAMWITGFDVPSLSTVYLDKPMRNHTLMQTIARANRVFEGKNNGLIVDYVGVFRNLQKALSIYAKPGQGNIDVPVKDKEMLFSDLELALRQTNELCSKYNVNIEKIYTAPAQSFEKIALIDDAVDQLLITDEVKKRFLQLSSLCWRLFKAILPDQRASQFEAHCQLIHHLGKEIRALSPIVNIDAVMDDIEDVLDVSIDSTGYIIREDAAEYTVDLSGLDFEKMRKNFEKKHKRTEIEKLKNTIEHVLEKMVEQNRTRMDYLKKFQDMIDEYNSGSKNVDIIYKDLVKFAESLNEEQRRHIGEQLTEEELALFDILAKPEPVLSEKERAQVKKVARELLDTLKREKLVLDWRKKQQTRADVLYTIEKSLDDELPRSYSTEIYRKKCELVYQHIYDNYYGNGRSLYSAA